MFPIQSLLYGNDEYICCVNCLGTLIIPSFLLLPLSSLGKEQILLSPVITQAITQF